MLPQLTQETLNEYAHDAQTIQQPYGADYAQGVRVGKTIPAKWWNWLFNAATKRIFQSKNDAQDMLTEMKNVVTDAGLTPDASDNTQLTQAIEEKADIQIGKYIERIKKNYLRKWYNPDFTLDGSSATVQTMQAVMNVNGVYIGNRSLECYYSKDFHEWRSVYVNNKKCTYIRSCVYFGAAWYMIATTLNVDEVYGVSYLKSTDGAAFQPVTLTKAGYESIYGYFFFIADNTLYYLALGYKVGGGATTLLYWTTDGSTWQNREATELPSATHISGSTEYSCHYPIKLAENKYVLGAAIFDTTTHLFTQTTTPGSDAAAYLFYNAFRMPNGQIFTRDNGSESQELVKINSDGTFSTMSGTYRYTGNVLLKGTRMEYSSSYFVTVYKEFSVDGDTFMSLPDEVLAPMQNIRTGIIDCIPYKGKWLVGLITGLSTQSSLVRRMLYIADNLSSDPSDYSVIRPPEEQYSSDIRTNLTCNDKAITFAGKVSFDDGQTWQDGTVDGNTSYTDRLYSSIPKEFNGDFYGTMNNGSSYGGTHFAYGRSITDTVAYKMAKTINMVIGYTLYLR